MDPNRVIGYRNDLPWRLPNDLKLFKEITTGKPIIMGRKTYESIGRPLPNRRNIVITGQKEYVAQGIDIVHSLSEAIKLCESEEEVMIIGGATIYQEALHLCHRMYVTEVLKEFTGDTWFPAYKKNEWVETRKEVHQEDERHDADYQFIVLDRKES